MADASEFDPALALSHKFPDVSLSLSLALLFLLLELAFLLLFLVDKMFVRKCHIILQYNRAGILKQKIKIKKSGAFVWNIPYAES